MRTALRIIGLVVLVVALGIFVDLRAVGRRLLTADLALVGLALALHLPMIFLKSWRWQGLTRVVGSGYGAKRSFAVFLIGLYAGTVTPAKVGEFIRASYLVKDGAARPGAAFASVLADRLFDLYFLLAASAVGVVWFGLAGSLSIAGVGVLLLVAAAPALLMSDSLVGWVSDRLFKVAARRMENAPLHAREFSRALRAQASLPVVARALALTAAGYAVYFVQCWALAHAVGIPMSVVDVGLAMALANLVSLAPITHAGIGTRDGVLIRVMALRGLSRDAAVALSTLVLLLFHVVSAVIGFVAFTIWPPADSREDVAPGAAGSSEPGRAPDAAGAAGKLI